jgi:hypothetical protein
MNRSKLLLALFLAQVLCLLITQTAFSQTEKLGSVKYTPPKGWTKSPKENAVIFSDINQTAGRFCFITLYGATPSEGTPEADFRTQWTNLVAKPWGADANPKTETQLDEGWTVAAAAAPIDFQGNKAVAFLTVVSGFGKTVAVLGIFNDESYLSSLTAFAEGMDIDKTPPAATNPNSNQRSQAANQNNQPGKFGLMTYTAPAGWSHQIFDDGVVFKPADLPAGEQLSVQIMQPLNASGTLDQALAASYQEAAAMYKATMMHYAGGANYQGNPAQKSFKGWEYIRGKGGVQIDNGSPYPPELGLEVFVVKVNNRFERIAILESRKNCQLAQRYYASDRIAYHNAIENLLFSLQFTDLDVPALGTGSIKGPGIVGVWQGISLSVGVPSSSQQLGVRYKVFSPIFLTNGQAYFGPKFPTEGLDGLNTRIPPELYRRDWGTYTFSNGRGVLRMPYADIPMRMEGNTLVITANQTDHKFGRLNSVDGARFNGTYTMSEAYGKIPAISFSSDGRFVDNGAVKILYHEYIDCLNPAVAGGSGTYEVKDHTITFNYSDGRKIKIAFPGAEFDIRNQSPATLLLSYDENRLTRQ